MHFLLILLLYGTFQLNNPKCLSKRYLCSLDVRETSESCVQVKDDKNKKYYLYVCPIGYSCDITKPAVFGQPNKCKLNEIKPKILPGESCEIDEDCFGENKCKSGSCEGKKLNQKCTTDEDCIVSAYCDKDTSTCQLQKVFNESCKNDFECQNNCVCSLKRCFYYYSLANDIESDNPKACESGFVSNGFCKDGLKSKEPNKPKPCETDEDCPLVDVKGVTQAFSECQCGYNAGGFSYCKLSEGDDEYKQELKLFKYIGNTNFSCHTRARYGPCHFIYKDEEYLYKAAQKRYELMSKITFND